MLSCTTSIPVAASKSRDRGVEVGAFATDPLRLDRHSLAVERLVGAERRVQLGVAGRDGRHRSSRRSEGAALSGASLAAALHSPAASLAAGGAAADAAGDGDGVLD